MITTLNAMVRSSKGDDPEVMVTRATTYAKRANLAPPACFPPQPKKIYSLSGLPSTAAGIFGGLPSARPHPPPKDVGMFYIHADPPKSLPPIPMRVSRRSQLTAALRQHARPIVIEDQELAGPFVHLLRARQLRLWGLGEFVANTMSCGVDQSYGANVEAHWYVGRYVLPGNVQKVILKPKPYGAGRPPRHLQA
jgi:hypothetical protein